MTYKVFLVEDEIVTREGIRDNVDWVAAGFELCGEAPDGEIALPLIEESKPDVLITDIKMPFMDGLQLSKIIREHMPWVKIIILSGHDEFNYAQSAVKLGVTEYLLKPISAQDLSKVLQDLSEVLDHEKIDRQKIKELQYEVDTNFILNREKFLLKLVMGGISTADAIEQSQNLGLDIVAKFYLIIFIRIELYEDLEPFDYHECQQIEQIILQLIGNNRDVFFTKKDLEELIILTKGDSVEQLTQESSFLAELIKNELDKQTGCNVVIEMGSPQNRIGDIHHSFAEAMVKSKTIQPRSITLEDSSARIELVNMDHWAIDNYLKFGSSQDFDEFFTTTILPVAETALYSSIIKHYLFVDIILTVSQFINNLGGQADHAATDVREIENDLVGIQTIEQIKSEMRKIFSSALTHRSSQINHERFIILQRARSYIDSHINDPDLQMRSVAKEFNLSPGHFSTIFHQEIGQTFRDYLSKAKINRAKELLSTTNLQCSEVALQCGFKDPHYFSYVFKKKTGLTPQQFRTQFEIN